MTAKDTTTTEQAKQQLHSDLEKLSGYCQADGTLWPSSELLESVEKSAKLLVAKLRKKPPEPIWRGFEILDGRRGLLRPANRVDNLVKRALIRLQEGGESMLDKLARQCGADRQKLVSDIESLKTGLSNAKGIDWEQHRSVLNSLSDRGTISLFCGNSPASPNVICYARTLELLIDDYRRQPLRRQSRPLLEWLARIHHPETKRLLAFDYATACDVERREKAELEEKELHRREIQRTRTRRHRQWYRGRWLYPGDWIRFRDEADFQAFYGKRQPLPGTCAGLHDSDCRSDLEACLGSLSCGRKLPDEQNAFYFHRTRNIARCRDCQVAEWIAQGFEVEDGFPHGERDNMTKGRVAERAKETLAREVRKLTSTKG